MKIRFINYRKEFNGKFPIRGWSPKFQRFWLGDIWHLEWRGYAIELDKRKNGLLDLIDPQRKLPR